MTTLFFQRLSVEVSTVPTCCLIHSLLIMSPCLSLRLQRPRLTMEPCGFSMKGSNQSTAFIPFLWLHSVKKQSKHAFNSPNSHAVWKVRPAALQVRRPAATFSEIQQQLLPGALCHDGLQFSNLITEDRSKCSTYMLSFTGRAAVRDE